HVGIVPRTNEKRWRQNRIIAEGIINGAANRIDREYAKACDPGRDKREPKPKPLVFHGWFSSSAQVFSIFSDILLHRSVRRSNWRCMRSCTCCSAASGVWRKAHTSLRPWTISLLYSVQIVRGGKE